MGAVEMPRGFAAGESSNGRAGPVAAEGKRAPAPPRIQYVSTAEIFAPLPPSKWVAPELHIGPGRPVMLAGYGSSAKTLTAQALALAITSGRLAWDRFETSIGEVRHLDYEQGAIATRRRYQRLAIGHGIELAELGDRLKLCAMPSVFLDDKQKAFDEFALASDGASLVVIDAFRGATPSSDENDSAVRCGLDVLTRVSERNGASFLVIHHAGKPKEGHDDARTIARGSSAIFDACGCVLVILGGKKGADPKRVRQTKQPAESEGAPIADFELVVEDVERDGKKTAGVRVVHRTIEQTDDESKSSQQYEFDAGRLRKAIEGQPGITMNQLTIRAGMKKGRAGAVLAALVDEGRIAVVDGPRKSKSYWPAGGTE